MVMQAGSASSMVGEGEGALQLGLSQGSWGGGGGPEHPCLLGSEVTSVQLEASSSHAKDRILSSWSWWVFVLGAII